jgi:hypothetical protein
LKFFEQRNDGSTEEYFLDVAAFEESGKVVFILSHTGQCSYEPSSKTETCTANGFSADKNETYPVWTYIIQLEADMLDTIFFRSPAEYSAFISSDTRKYDAALYPESAHTYYYRCQDFTASALTPHLAKVNGLTYDETDPMLSPELDGPANLRGIAEQVSKVLKPTF